MNKQYRNYLKYKKYKKRIERFCRNILFYETKSGERIYNPLPVDVIKDNGQVIYKTTSTPCSCSMCSHDKYQRHLKIQEDRKLLQDYLNED